MDDLTKQIIASVAGAIASAGFGAAGYLALEFWIGPKRAARQKFVDLRARMMSDLQFYANVTHDHDSKRYEERMRLFRTHASEMESLIRVVLTKKRVEELKASGIDLNAAAAATRGYSNSIGADAKLAEKAICKALDLGPLYD